MGLTGRCRCGAIQYSAEGEPSHSALCHCADCRHSSGAPVVGFALFPAERVTISGHPTDYESSPGVIRQFCGTCGTNLFYRNEAVFPGQVDIHTATLDDPEALPPQVRIQIAEAASWFARFETLPAFQRYPE
ncbi:GFA family protein [Methylobacterium sp. Leaf93]|uniref:GFA family protein n=1 Tax=Methylobacterium sp. Leaf93 TaxID=1736249 RepID=UPI0007004D61|nr:GFA family protein [Methylobacterium sp. Leaf93]KQP05698.1 aldehyde-activating protein [Methylobacterium sp. Leaf93]